MEGSMSRSLAGVAAVGLAIMAVCPAHAQQSASYRLTENVFNQGGHPANGVVLSSTSWRVTLDAVGDGVASTALASASFRMEGGFPAGYPPPGEVHDLRVLADRETLAWDPEPSIGVYNLYRDLLSHLSGLGYGTCAQSDLEDETTGDPAVPPAADGYFYLVTAENRLREEGTKGFDSGNEERQNATPCP
jgi:hypothetical protein